MRGKIVRIIRACELSETILHYILINDQELCPGQPCELSGRCELARVKLSTLYCIKNQYLVIWKKKRQQTYHYIPR